MVRCFKILLISTVLSGCSTIDTNRKDRGHPYAGTQNAITTAPCNLALSGTILFIPAPFIIADIPLSFIADTIFLPWTMTQKSQKEREEVTYTVSEYCDVVIDGMKMTRKTPNVKENEVEKKSQEESINLNISHAEHISDSKDLMESISELEKMIHQELRASKVNLNSDLVINISIEKFEYVSSLGREMLGALIGSAEIKIKVTVMLSGNVIKGAVFEAKSKFSEGVSGASTLKQLKVMAMKITEFINKTSEQN